MRLWTVRDIERLYLIPNILNNPLKKIWRYKYVIK